MAKIREHERLEEEKNGVIPWKKWGPYLSERQWGTVREDYSAGGDAWDYFTHDQARSRTYRWGEDGLAGISDDKQRLCFCLALWNGRDAILKERLFGLTNSEGNHGEDVKEYYFYLDSTPTHSYMKFLYKYPQAAFPYEDLVQTNRARGREQMEYELLDTGVFDDDRYFDVFVEYAKASAEDLLIKITVHNRGKDEARLCVIPTLWFRNTWSWTESASPRPLIKALSDMQGCRRASTFHPELGPGNFYCEGEPTWLFTENETNHQRVFGTPNASPYVKDAFHRHVIEGDANAINPKCSGTKAGALYDLVIPGEGSREIMLRLTRDHHARAFGHEFLETFESRKAEADAFYEALMPPSISQDARLVTRQALAGMLWSKQYYHFDLDAWLKEHKAHPLSPGQARLFRNRQWYHMVNSDIISMPDKWEYPWYAAWDLAFHTIALNMVDPEFARRQLKLMLSEVYLHPSGQIPAYEWNFSDVNPPVHAWAVLFAHSIAKVDASEDDFAFLEESFQKLLLNFTWWVNRKDPNGRNVFDGGFLGLDNIGVFDRSARLPEGGYLEQADGTAWMLLFSQNMLELSLELAARDPRYETMAMKFIQHTLSIAAAMDRVGANYDDDLWDEEDGFYYDILRMPDGSAKRLKVRSMVGLLPLCAATVIPRHVIEKLPWLSERLHAYLEKNAAFLTTIAPPDKPGVNGRHLFSVLTEDKLRRVLTRMLDEERFLSPHGIRSLSRWHKDHPYVLKLGNTEHSVGYLPAESTTGMFGGNSNWRGPIWFPVNALIIRALMQLYRYYGDSFRIECPTGSGQMMNLFGVAKELADRLASIFLRDIHGHRPVFGGAKKFQTDPHWRDYLLFYEYFHGDNGAGLGASHQTGWTGIVARLIQMFGAVTPERALEDDAVSALRCQPPFAEKPRDSVIPPRTDLP
jgi:hypothetical protein